MRTLITTALTTLLAAAAYGETVRPQLTQENRFPEPLQLEMSIGYFYQDFNDESELGTLDGTFRLGLADGFAAKIKVPFEDREETLGSMSESGVGDVQFGAELRLWEDIFTYPYLLLLGNVSLDTADEDKNLGNGESFYELGLTLGTVTYDQFHWAAEGRYQFYEDSEDRAVGAASILWEIGPAFAVMVEGQLREDPDSVESDSPFLFLGGIYYEITKQLNFSLHGGTENNSNKDAFAGGEVSYTF